MPAGSADDDGDEDEDEDWDMAESEEPFMDGDHCTLACGSDAAGRLVQVTAQEVRVCCASSSSTSGDAQHRWVPPNGGSITSGAVCGDASASADCSAVVAVVTTTHVHILVRVS